MLICIYAYTSVCVLIGSLAIIITNLPILLGPVSWSSRLQAITPASSVHCWALWMTSSPVLGARSTRPRNIARFFLLGWP